MPPPYGFEPNGFPPQPQRRKKRKLAAALLSMIFPGTGHMYLGLMSKGVIIMLLLALNICGIVFVVEQANNVLIIVLLSLLIPILYFYNLFDVLQQTDAVNERHAAGWPTASGWPSASGWNGSPPAQGGSAGNVPVLGIVLLAVGGVALFSTANTEWTRWLLHSSGSMAGAIVLIAIGALVWLWEKRGHNGKHD
ncbi:hypothetical protein J19TS2_07800 [Cohnella xylanilytica]|nr:hypothetical protein J19TS2_07800 [Cohnella xylanilytica]